MSNINFVKLCESVLLEMDELLLQEASAFITALCRHVISLRQKYSALISAESDRAKKVALENKRKIELFKYRNQLSTYLIAQRLVTPEETTNRHWLDRYIENNEANYDGILNLMTTMLGSTVPAEPDPRLLPPRNQLPLALE